MEPKAWVKSITFSDDTIIDLAENDVVVVVGPNNSGKSATLRAIRDKFAIPNAPSPVIKTITLQREGTAADLLDWLRDTTNEVEGAQNVPPHFSITRQHYPDRACIRLVGQCCRAAQQSLEVLLSSADGGRASAGR